MKLLCSALCGIFLLLHCAEGVYQPECDSLDNVINNIQQSVVQINEIGLGGSTINCTKKTDCDGFTCILDFQSQKTEITVELKPCEEPPQMFILMRDLDGTVPFVEQTVSHGDSFPIPGLQYTYEIFIMQAYLGVQFQNVSNGLRIGLSLDIYASGVKVMSVPLSPPTVVSVPDCTTTGEDNQCTHMQALVDTLDPPHDFKCFMNQDCEGFNCTGTIQTPFGVESSNVLNVVAKLVVDSCTSPVSYVFSVGEPNRPPSDTEVFSQSENVQLDLQGLPAGLTTDLNVTMIPYTQDIDYIRTTIEVFFCYPGMECLKNIFIDNALVPIPPCDNPIPFPTSSDHVSMTPLPGSVDECTTMMDIAADIQNNDFLEPGLIICHRNRPCDGIECTINTSPLSYDISMKLLHCDVPIRIHLVIGNNNAYHEEQDVYNDEIVSIGEIIHNSSLKFHIVKIRSDEVELALLLKLQESSSYEQSVYLIKDRIVPVDECSPSTPTGNPPSTAMMTTKKMGQKTEAPETKVTPKQEKKMPTNDPKNTKKDPLKNQQSNSVSIGVGVGIAVLIAVVVIILVGVWYYRRNHTSIDSVALIESSSAPI